MIGAMLTLALLTEHARWRAFAAFVGLKTVTVAASAYFHLSSFRSPSGARQALILDLLCVPCSIWGNTCLVAYTYTAVLPRRVGRWHAPLWDPYCERILFCH